MQDIKDEQISDSSFTLSYFCFESDKEESLHIESFCNNYEKINEWILDNRS